MESLVCRVCRHDHSCGEGEVCGICGHIDTVKRGGFKSVIDPPPQGSEILPDFLYLGCFNFATREKLLEALGISRVLNTVAGHEYPRKRQFTCHSLPKGKELPFGDATQFLDQCEKDKVRVLVYCMTGKSRSPAIVIAYLMRCKRWRFRQSYEWVKERRPSVDLSPDVTRQLQEYEQEIFDSVERPALLPKQDFNLVQSSLSPSSPVSDAPLVVSFTEYDVHDFKAYKLKFIAGLSDSPHCNISAETEEKYQKIHFGIQRLLKRKKENVQCRAIDQV